MLNLDKQLAEQNKTVILEIRKVRDSINDLDKTVALAVQARENLEERVEKFEEVTRPMTDWSWALILILAAGAFGLVAAQAWRLEAKRRGEDAWEKLVEERFKGRGSDDTG